MSIYQEVILDHYKHPRNFGEIDQPDKSSRAINTVCGDKIFLTAEISKGAIKQVKFSGTGCAISVASASMLTDYLKGKKLTDLRKLDQSFMLKLLSIELTPNRLKCALLPLEALHKLI
ncbi:SUF system NifU family Fe-S cluster assembly protein [Candidatus Roizmanbacteria bacterium RIFCSPLOWO2_02_FULL_37_19]|uniref:SUF system NifU family Fe-S cluster assembly protein n=1 Tax=Candidatus Roizmanbacteria bacterium RIFCSPHIGHO2_02_FULL_37_24 TaxID=1802037 RepID=A0A1F7GWP7_9BACT|nr:MAG: SUF system NifU family Fe-S cluster assembly protein [Candidatus Roizmanbacteria bacterium RIFCSPHIGHO2_01_FULL_38_41]OGK23517.1 MAG: SUF system NifU family Fe-S cluster assembly protein [Candidatus Roizmanbacteria bacterium RIFCSPHIGHO2_02_FULL_37_24]OGK31923.1 MAG: SUF system NifU family Fe-S cluster assembly protein [Candidatus Roizmanbacteria bacterium RIFCSPHIGHO2_12_FULL_37_23]OGK45407.1 MAG: SUF system NifU family Fe-S cluster assembly protein [Candidatus Roizmanbacteria bacterium